MFFFLVLHINNFCFGLFTFEKKLALMTFLHQKFTNILLIFRLQTSKFYVRVYFKIINLNLYKSKIAPFFVTNIKEKKKKRRTSGKFK
jgi:hypothetical protein